MNFKKNNKDTVPFFEKFKNIEFPTTKDEDWKYTSVKEILSHTFEVQKKEVNDLFDVNHYLIDKKAQNYLIFINGNFCNELSSYNKNEIHVSDLTTENFISNKFNFFKYTQYNKDGFVELNQQFHQNGLFIEIPKNKKVENVIYIYHFSVCADYHSLSIPKIAIMLNSNSEANFVEDFIKIGENISLTNAVSEFVICENAVGKYYKILDEGANANHIGTTQINQIGKSVFTVASFMLSGNIIRNNLNFSLLNDYSTSNLFGLTLLKSQTHVDNHTVVDHAVANCESSQLYKAILDEEATSVFNGKIFVRQDAQKTNAYQSSKNILLSNTANAFSKPQLEIWADDVKCSHGHATGQLNKDHVFYLKARGIGEKTAIKMLTKAYAQDVLNAIDIELVKLYLEEKIEKRFE